MGSNLALIDLLGAPVADKSLPELLPPEKGTALLRYSGWGGVCVLAGGWVGGGGYP